MKISKIDGNAVSMALKSLARLRLREYTKNENSEKFKEIKRKKKARIKLEGQKLLDKNIEAANEEKGLKWLKNAKNLAARPCDDTSTTFTLPKHINRNLKAKQSANEIADYFAKISQEFKPIEEDSLPPDLTRRLNEDKSEHPIITEHQMYENI